MDYWSFKETSFSLIQWICRVNSLCKVHAWLYVVVYTHRRVISLWMIDDCDDCVYNVYTMCMQHIYTFADVSSVYVWLYVVDTQLQSNIFVNDLWLWWLWWQCIQCVCNILTTYLHTRMHCDWCWHCCHSFTGILLLCDDIHAGCTLRVA